jgi:hypothetical protein
MTARNLGPPSVCQASTALKRLLASLYAIRYIDKEQAHFTTLYIFAPACIALQQNDRMTTLLVHLPPQSRLSSPGLAFLAMAQVVEVNQLISV